MSESEKPVNSQTPKKTPSFNRDAPGYWIMVGSILFGVSPLAISVVAFWFGSDIGITLHWLTLATAPIGFISALVGLVLALVGLVMSPPALAGRSVETLAAPSKKLRLTLFGLYSAVVGVILISSIVNLTFGWNPSNFAITTGLIAIAAPVFFAIWSWRIRSGRSLLQLHRVARLTSFVGLAAVVGAGFFSTFDSIGVNAPEPSQLAVSSACSWVVTIAVLATLFIAPVIRAVYVFGLKKAEAKANRNG